MYFILIWIHILGNGLTIYKFQSIAVGGTPVPFTVDITTTKRVMVTVRNADPSKELTIAYSKPLDQLTIARGLGELDVSNAKCLFRVSLTILIEKSWTCPHLYTFMELISR